MEASPIPTGAAKMTFQHKASIAILALLGFAAEQANAQPIAPPRRPTFSSYSSLVSPGGGYYGFGGGGGYGGGGGGYGNFGYGGFGNYGGNNNGLLQQQNLQLQNQLTSFNQNITNLQSFLATGVNPNFPATGHPAVFNNLGHWYGGGGGGGGTMGGGVGSRTAGIGYSMGGSGSGSNSGAAAAGANAPRTAGTGIPVGGPRK